MEGVVGIISIPEMILGRVRQVESSARGFSPARMERNHVHSPPDDFLISLPDCLEFVDDYFRISISVMSEDILSN
jgi:hypothetical protein